VSNVKNHDTTVSEIPLSRPDFDEAEARAVADVLASGWVSQGPRVARFEETFAARVGARYGVATTSCTTALHLALRLANIGPGDEVVCPSYSFIATANAILYVGATPVFADIDADTWNIDPADALTRVTSRTKAIIPVHQVGLAADLDRLLPLESRGITIIEDAACAIGSMYRDRPIGSSGHMACFSFHPRKTISLGEGGMLTTDDAALADRARRLRSHGASVSDHARHQAKGLVYEEYVELGYNYRMTDVQAAIGLEQMRKLDGFLARRKHIARRYDEAFGPLQGVQVPAHPPYASHAYQSYGIRLLPECRADRDQVLRDLAALGISCRRGIPPIHLEPLYRDRFGRVSLPVTEDVAARSIFLPIFASLSSGDQQRVIDAVVGMAS
jgi:perosamine synthetase